MTPTPEITTPKSDIKSDITTLADLIPDSRNLNKGTERGDGMLETSLRTHGAGRSVLVDRDGHLIAGNKTAEKCAQIGIEDIIIVPSDGTKLVVVQRTDISLDSPEGRALAIADNRVGEVSLAWDVEALSLLAEEGVPVSDYFSDTEIGLLLGDLAREKIDVAEDVSVPIADSMKQPSSRNVLTFGDKKIPMTDAEASAFGAALDVYREQTGTFYGFINHLLAE